MTRIVDPYDELTGLFLSEEPAASAGVTAATPVNATMTELLLVGHLPVRAGLWLTPYADALARQSGPVALVRMEGADVSVQVLRGPDRTQEWRDPAGVQEAIHDLGGGAAAWVIRPRGESSAEEWIQAGADRITILSSADDAAVVAAYQVIKNLADAAQHLERQMPPVGLAIVGAEPRNAAIVVDRVNRTAAAHLGVDVPLTVCLPRMDAGIRSTRYMAFPSQAGIALPLVMQWIHQAEQDAHHAAPASLRFPIRGESVASPVAAIADAQEVTGPSSPGETVEATQKRSEPVARPPLVVIESDDGVEDEAPVEAGPKRHRASVSSTASAAATAGMKLSPKATAEQVEMKHPCQSAEPHRMGKPMGLCDHVRGLRPLPFRPPGHERVELAADDAGRLHVLAWEAQMRDLKVVETWARRHREIISMACQQMTLDFSQPVVCHLFTDEPANIADLHDTGLHLHLLARVEVDGRHGWYVAALNRPA